EVEGGTAPSPPSPPPSIPPGGGGGVTIVLPANVVFEGRAYPKAFLTLLRNGQVAATFFAEDSGLFEKELTGVPSGTYAFGIWAQDSKGRKSVTVSFTVGILPERTTTISGIFISPTIEVGPTQVEKGEIVDIAGQVFPESEVNVFIASDEMVKTTKASLTGDWIYKLDTGSLEETEHKTRARAVYGDGEQSPFSQTLSFLVVKRGALVCQGADLNFDKKVNLIDFSILLYYWHQKKSANICADINQDGIVDLVDFSIMMYYWTK
ncbi:MAG: dockerin type I repeat-containing protein, partial [bacterium]